jgi:hypothetical protein
MTLEAVNSVNPVEIPTELNRKIEQATKNLFPGYRRHLENVSALNAENAATICDYIAAAGSPRLNTPTYVWFLDIMVESPVVSLGYYYFHSHIL